MTMVRKTIAVTQQQSDWIKSRIAEGLYTDESEYIRDLIRHDMISQSPYDLGTGLLEGYAQLANGQYRKGDMKEIVARAKSEMRLDNNG